VLFFFHRELGSKPLLPSSLQCVNFGITFLHEFPCHPGTGSLAGSGSVEYKYLVLGVLFDPRVDLVGFFPHSSLDFDRAFFPV